MCIGAHATLLQTSRSGLHHMHQAYVRLNIVMVYLQEAALYLSKVVVVNSQ